MRLAFSTNAYLRFPFEDAVRRIAALGYDGVEVMADVPHAWPAGLLPQQCDALSSALASQKLEISNVNAFMMQGVGDRRQPYWHPSWIEPDRNYRRIRVDHTIRCLALARALGAASISTEPGGPVPAGTSWEHALTEFAEELRPVAERAERQQVRVLIEPEPGLLIERGDQFLELIGRVRSPALGLNFDVGHFFCVGEAPELAAHRLAAHIGHVHLEDIPVSREHRHLIPGEGAIDLKAVLRALHRIGYDGWITIELYPYVNDPDAAARIAMERVRDLLSDI